MNEPANFWNRKNRGDDWKEILADEGAEYDKTDRINLNELEPLIATPSSPGNVVPVTYKLPDSQFHRRLLDLLQIRDCATFGW